LDDELFEAAKRGDFAACERLLKQGANASAAYRVFPLKGMTPLYIAVRGGHLGVVMLLLRDGADVNLGGNNETPLEHAAGLGHVEIVRVLLDKGADINAGCDHDYSALHRASEKGRLALVNLLVSRGADVNCGDRTPLLRAASGERPEHLAVVEFLLANGADMRAPKRDQYLRGWTPLHSAAREGVASVAAALLAKGANIEARDALERTALFCAAENGHVAVVELLLSKGACSTTRGQFQGCRDSDLIQNPIGRETPKGIAEIRGHKAVVQVFSKYESGDK
jgi:ankyrin repeat protein